MVFQRLPEVHPLLHGQRVPVVCRLIENRERYPTGQRTGCRVQDIDGSVHLATNIIHPQTRAAVIN